MSKEPGYIYDMGEGRFGFAPHSKQHKTFQDIKKVYLIVFTDRLCTKPELHPVTGKQYVTLKAVDKLVFIGFSD